VCLRGVASQRGTATGSIPGPVTPRQALAEGLDRWRERPAVALRDPLGNIGGRQLLDETGKAHHRGTADRERA